MQITATEIDRVCELVKDLCGLELNASKSYLIESRLKPIAQEHGLSSYGDVVDAARNGRPGKIRQEIIDAITTQETLFFRDGSPFDALRFKALPELIDSKANTANPRRLRFWSAACSTGQEPYSIAMVLHEMIPDIHSWDIQILATDICDQAIAKASRGWFTDMEIERGLPNSMRDQFFRRAKGGWQVEDSLRGLLSFRRLNLMDALPPIGPIDFVFCRNVAIYFEKEQRAHLFQRIKSIMSREAYLFVGGSESLISLGSEFRPQSHCRSTFYRPNMPQVQFALS